MKRPRVLLIKSRSLATKLQGASMPPLGLLYVAAALRARLGADVRILDAYLDRDILKRTAEEAGVWMPDVVGISALTAESFLAGKIAAAVKASAPAVPVVLGGPYPSSDPEGALADPCVDAAVIGEGEETFCELAAIIAAEGPRWKMPGAADRVAGLALSRDGAVERTAPRPPIANLDSLPLPAWDLIDYKKFWKTGGMASVGVRPYLPLFTSRGCPYRCVYCHSIFGKRFRGRSPESVAEEVSLIHRLGTRDIEVLDDIANFDADRFDGTLELLLRRGLESKLSFPNGIRADIVRPESLDLLKRVGTGEISVAVETASQRLQELIGKNLSLEKISRTIDMLAARRIFTRGFFMLGLPTETEEELRATIRFACESRLHIALFFTPNPYPNTGLREMYEKAGRLPSAVNSIDYEYTAAPFNASAMSDETYHRLYRGAFLKFHLDPVRVLRIARDAPFGWDLPRRAWRLFRNNLDQRRLRETC
jgi:radical SAM superfamily enzyme YgiQ (UPF0313 family)